MQVALQFPDHLLVDSVTVAAMLEKNVDDNRKMVYILGDTSYGRYVCHFASVEQVICAFLVFKIICGFGFETCIAAAL